MYQNVLLLMIVSDAAGYSAAESVMYPLHVHVW